MRQTVLVIALYLLLVCTGCAYLKEINQETGQPRWVSWAYPVLEIAEDMLPPPWNWVVGGVLIPALGVPAEIARRKLKNSQPGKLFGPMKAPEE